MRLIDNKRLLKITKVLIKIVRTYTIYIFGTLFVPFLTFPKIIKNRPLGFALTLAFGHNFLSNLEFYIYKPYRFYQVDLTPSFATFVLFFFIILLQWFIIVVIIYFLARKLFKGRGIFKSTFIVLSFCTLPLIILRALNLTLTYNIYHYFEYLLWLWYFILVYFAIVQTHKISGWKAIIIICLVNIPISVIFC